MSGRTDKLASSIDHTLLKADAASPDIRRLCAEALEHGFASVCVNSGWVSLCRELLAGSRTAVAAVVGFPLGAAAARVKAAEAAYCVEQGAAELDMVLPVGLLLEGRFAEVENDIREVVRAGGTAVVKVILETSLLTDEQKRIACQLAEQAGAGFVKTSTGFGPGGATIGDVRLLRESVTPAVKVKASGGIRDLQTALAMLDAGADRLGTSSGVAIIQGLQGGGSY